MSYTYLSSDPVINATDLNFNAGTGGLGLGAGMGGFPAPGTDILPGATVGSSGTPASTFSLPTWVTNDLPTLPPLTANGASTSGSASTAAPTTTGTAAPTTGTGSPATVSWSDKISDWFVRGAVIVAGFIFVAVGLSMFKDQRT